MRSLTPAEALVVGALLDARPASNRDRIARARIPARTFETAAERLLSAGIVYDRYVPNPTRFGFPAVGFALARPFVERAEALVDRWLRTPGNVVLWRSPEWVFGVFFRTLATPPSRLGDALVRPDEASRAFWLSVDARDPQVPAYFDFEGAWAALNETQPSDGYPRPLAGAGEEVRGLAGSRPPESDRAVGWTLARRPLAGGAAAAGPRRRSPRFFSRSERRALSHGLVEHRVFLDLTRIPATRGRSASGLAWALGRLRERHTPEALFAALRSRGQVAPFLFATDERQVLLGALARSVAGGVPVGSAGAVRSPLQGILQEHLEAIEVIRSPLESIAVVRDHRYDLLLVGPNATPRRVGSNAPT